MNGQTIQKLNLGLETIYQMEEPLDQKMDILSYLDGKYKARKPNQIRKGLNMNQNTTRRVVAELLDAGYLIKSDKIKSAYLVAEGGLSRYILDTKRKHFRTYNLTL